MSFGIKLTFRQLALAPVRAKRANWQEFIQY